VTFVLFCFASIGVGEGGGLVVFFCFDRSSLLARKKERRETIFKQICMCTVFLFCFGVYVAGCSFLLPPPTPRFSAHSRCGCVLSPSLTEKKNAQQIHRAPVVSAQAPVWNRAAPPPHLGLENSEGEAKGRAKT
jgi:hypothetical protein